MKTAVLNSFLKFYVMGSPQVDLLDIVHVKVGFFAVLKMCVRARLGKFVWSTLFVQCVLFLDTCKLHQESTQNLEKSTLEEQICAQPVRRLSKKVSAEMFQNWIELCSFQRLIRTHFELKSFVSFSNSSL